jgi:type I restriction enzyme S subunit
VGVFFEDFPNYGFMTSFVRNQMRVLAKGVQRFVIGKPEFESIKVQIPSYKEQEKIAKYFRSLDCEISALSQQLEKLQQIKSACLDNMFV